MKKNEIIWLALLGLFLNGPFVEAWGVEAENSNQEKAELPGTTVQTDRADLSLGHEPIRKGNEMRMTVLAGLVRISDEVGRAQGFTLGAQVDFTHYLGVRLQGQHLHANQMEYNEAPNALRETDKISNRWGGQASFVFTPIHTQIWSHGSVSISAHVGMTSWRKRQHCVRSYKYTRVYDDGRDCSSDEIELVAKSFTGISAQLAFNDKLGLELFTSMLDEKDSNRVAMNLIIQF